MQEARRLSGRNCIYGKPLDIIDKGKVFHVNVCLYNKNVNTGLEVCNNTEECNAFICKFSKKDIEESFNKELSDSVIRSKKYPELNVLEWVLDKTLDDARKEPTIFVKIIVLAINLLEGLIKTTVRNQKRLMDNK